MVKAPTGFIPCLPQQPPLYERSGRLDSVPCICAVRCSGGASVLQQPLRRARRIGDAVGHGIDASGQGGDAECRAARRPEWVIGDRSARCSLLTSGISPRCANGGCGPYVCILWRQTSRRQASWPSFSRRPRTNPEVILPWPVPAAEGAGFLATRDGIDSMCCRPV